MKNYVIKTNNNNYPTFFDEALDLFKPLFFDEHTDFMKTDIKENENNYELDIEMPGYNKDEINIDIEEGYLTVSAKKAENQEEKDKQHYIKKERMASCSRSFYVGDVEEENVKAKFDNGVLNIILPKEQEQKPQKRNILID